MSSRWRHSSRRPRSALISKARPPSGGVGYGFGSMASIASSSAETSRPLPHGRERLIAHDAVDPAASFAARGVKTGGFGPDVHEGVVQHVLGAGAVAHDAQRHTEQTAAFVLVNAMQGRAITLRAVGEGGFVIKRGRGGRQGGRGPENRSRRSSADGAARRGGETAGGGEQRRCYPRFPGSRTAEPAFVATRPAGGHAHHTNGRAMRCLVSAAYIAL